MAAAALEASDDAAILEADAQRVEGGVVVGVSVLVDGLEEVVDKVLRLQWGRPGAGCSNPGREGLAALLDDGVDPLGVGLLEYGLHTLGVLDAQRTSQRERADYGLSQRAGLVGRPAVLALRERQALEVEGEDDVGESGGAVRDVVGVVERYESAGGSHSSPPGRWP